MKVDLHIHTVCSDGQFTAAELMKKAAENKVEYLSFADGDHTLCLAAAKSEAAKYGINYIPGISIGAWCEQYSLPIQLIGYYMDEKDSKLTKLIAQMWEEAAENVDRRIFALKKENVNISVERLRIFASEKYPNYPEKQIGATVIRQFMEKYLKIETSAGQYIYSLLAKYKVQLIQYHPYEEVLEALKSAEAKIVLAHPGLYEDKWNKTSHEVKEIILLVKKLGVTGLEAYTPYNTPFQQESYAGFAKRNDMFITSGSDYQGYAETECKMGEQSCPDWLVNDLKAKFFK